MTPLADVVQRRLRNLGWSQAQLASHLGRSESWVSKFLDGKIAIPELTTLKGLSQVLDLPFTALLHAAGYPVENNSAKLKQIEAELEQFGDIKDDVINDPQLLKEINEYARFRLQQRRG